VPKGGMHKNGDFGSNTRVFVEEM